MKTIVKEILNKYIIQEQSFLCLPLHFFFPLSNLKAVLVHYITTFQHLICHNLATLINKQVITSALPFKDAFYF